ncbi:hypothetical protein GQ651_02540 [Alphaproteobacteria bacterium GH1-50]|uniref:Dolichyl-phosphate-mannose-protein mannosyltransferase n=1 Tax=Kangsaoukella pontilimi TaxID=2691042 RepID=A0A7C9MDZ7_9RHOB|nr:hypothetical protein [Kangsaoukella pontilimi]
MPRQSATASLVAAALAFVLLAVLVSTQSRAGCVCLESFGVDTLFILDILSRVSVGETPHVDFTTPIGALPFWAVGRGGGPLPDDFILMQGVFTAFVMGAGAWLALSRLGPFATLTLLCSVAVLGTSLTSSADPGVTMALYYNRWGWIAALVLAVSVAVPPTRPNRPWADGLCFGTLALALLLTKITFFVAVSPLAAIVLLSRRDWVRFTAAAVSFAAGMAIVALLAGTEFWPAYLDDLIWVATNPIRLTPGVSAADILSAPEVWAAAAAVLLAFRFRGPATGTLALLAAGAALFIQLQNFGAAPLWTIGAVTLSLVLVKIARSKVESLSWGAAAIVFGGFALLQLTPMVLGTIRTVDTAKSDAFVPMLPGVARLDGLRVPAFHIGPIVRSPSSDGAPVPIQSESCLVTGGYIGHLTDVAETLAHVPGPVFVADAQSPYWMVNGQPPLPGAAPWNYASLKGLEHATHIAVPTCAFKPSYQRALLRRIDTEGLLLEEVYRTEAATLYSFRRP